MNFGIASSHVRYEGEGDKRVLKGTVRLTIPLGRDIPPLVLTPMRKQEAGLVAALHKVGATAWADDLDRAIADADEGFRTLSGGADRHASDKPADKRTPAPDWRTVAKEAGLLTAPAPAKPAKPAPRTITKPAPAPAGLGVTPNAGR
jgi:hypothetical protein